MTDTTELRKLAEAAEAAFNDEFPRTQDTGRKELFTMLGPSGSSPRIVLELLDTIDRLTAERDKCGSGAGCLHKDAMIDSLTAELAECKAKLAALEGQQGEPVAWVSTPALRELKKDELDWAAAWNAPTDPDPVALYTRPQPTGARELAPSIQAPQNQVWLVANKTFSGMFWSEDAAKNAAASASVSLGMTITRIALLDAHTQPAREAQPTESAAALARVVYYARTASLMPLPKEPTK